MSPMSLALQSGAVNQAHSRAYGPTETNLYKKTLPCIINFKLLSNNIFLDMEIFFKILFVNYSSVA